MLRLLAACGVVYLLLGDGQEALMLMGFVLMVMGLSFVQQRRSDRSLAALRELASPVARVMRSGQLLPLPASKLVVGDVVLLAEGDRVPADAQLLWASNLAVDESLLTGESVPVSKEVQASTGLAAGQVDEAASRPGLVLSGTLVTRGSARALVVACGAQSALGRIGQALAEIEPAPTPIQREMKLMVRRLALLGLGLAGLLALAYGLRWGAWMEGLLAGLTLAMAALPEELPVVLTLFLSLGAWRLTKDRVLARSLPAVERMGSVGVLCVDKTGTLTANRMALRRLLGPKAQVELAPSGPGFATPAQQRLAEELHPLLEIAVLACHRHAFDPMEAAIQAAGQTLLQGTEHLHSAWTLRADHPLSPELLAMSRVWQSPDEAELIIAAKGSPEAIIELCHLDPARAATLNADVAKLASAGLRVLGVAQARFPNTTLPRQQHDFNFQWLGLLGLEDPLRPEVPPAIAACQAAGIRVVMMTGDHPATATAIARQAGLRVEAAPLTGTELTQLDDTALRLRLAGTEVFCRMQPEHKLRLVRAFQAAGEVVAMSGDGVNDGPALKAADIGVAMGARGTEVAREAADLVLLNDDFSALVEAVRQGRRVGANLRKTMVFVVAIHVPIVGLALLPVVMGGPLLLMPVHILLLQLIIDPACTLVFEAEPLEAGAMLRPPPRPPQALFSGEVMSRGLWQGGLLGLILLAMLLAAPSLSGGAPSSELGRSLVFITLALGNLALIDANRRLEPQAGSSAWTLPPTLRWMGAGVVLTLGLALWVPALRRLLSFETLTAEQLLLVVGAALVARLGFQAVKWAHARGVRRWSVDRASVVR